MNLAVLLLSSPVVSLTCTSKPYSPSIFKVKPDVGRLKSVNEKINF